MRFEKYLILFLVLLIQVMFLGHHTLKSNTVAGNTITVFCKNSIGKVNKKIFGNNVIAYDPSTYEGWGKNFYGYSDYGSGIWDPLNKKPVSEVIELAKQAGISVLRFPGGCGTHHYNWKNAIGNKREHFLYGLDEFVETCRIIGAEPVITVSYFTGNKKDAADLVEYLNSKVYHNNSKGERYWSALRKKNGSFQPHGVKYFEIGNEVYHGDHQGIKNIKAEAYARKYLAYYRAMKSVDPSIKIGVVLHTPDWNKRVMRIIKNKVDFGIVHTYPYPKVGINETSQQEISKEIFRITLAEPIIKDEFDYKNTLEIMKRYSGQYVPLGITEYNAGLSKKGPIPYRHALGTALVNAELIRIFTKPGLDILMANYWQFSNSFWGMVRSKKDFTKQMYPSPVEYVKRPNFYIYELYNKYFGDELLKTEVDSKTYKVNVDVSLLKRFFNAVSGDGIPCLTVNASRNKKGNIVYLMVVNKNMDEKLSAKIKLVDFAFSGVAFVRVLNGPYVDSTNEDDFDLVKVRTKKIKVRGGEFVYSFEPHSFTAIEIVGVKSTPR